MVSPLYAASFDCSKATTETEIAVCFDLGYKAFEKEEFQEAFDYWKPLADAGEAHAQYNIAQLYYGNQQSILFSGGEFFKGYGINRNAAREDAVEEAVKWYLLSAKQGVADAQFNLSIIYELEFGDDVTGRKWAELASKNGHIKAQWNVSGSVDCNKAKTETEKAICRTAEVEFSDSMQIEGEWSMKKLPAKFAHAAVFDCDKATTEKAKVICISAHEGDVDAQFEFGKLFASGGIIVLDNKQAAFWFLKAAEQGHPKAQWAMGAFYGYGMGGVELNYEKAIYWYTKAAEQGDAAAKNDLGLMFYDGLGVEQDYKQAAYWLSKAAEQGKSESQNLLGLMFYNGLGVEQDYKKAAYWLSKAAEQGILEAQFKLESIQFEKPYDQLKSGYYFKAIDAFQIDAEVGNPISLIYLFFNLNELDMDKYETEFREACTILEDNFSEYLNLWENDAPLYTALATCQFGTINLEKAILDGDPLAMFLKGFMPIITQDPPPSKFKTLEYYEQAALLGFCPAMLFTAGTHLEESSEAMMGPSPNIAYAWNHAAQRYGCSVTLFERDFNLYNELDQEVAENLADDILKKIQDNVLKLQND